MNAVKEDVEKLIEKELESANKKFSPFHSGHEGYAIIKEEVEEAEEQLDYVKHLMDCIWINIKHDCTQYADVQAKELKRCAINLAAEAIQVAAMAQKFIDSTENTPMDRICKILTGKRNEDKGESD